MESERKIQMNLFQNRNRLTNTENKFTKEERQYKLGMGLISTHYMCGCKITSVFFSPFIFISWRLITLQYCSGFCHALTWVSHGFTCVHHPNPPSHLPPYPILWVFPVHQPRALVSCIQPGLVICFTLDSILVSMLFSLNIPPTPSVPLSDSLRPCGP